jgi:hypothetical protein
MQEAVVFQIAALLALLGMGLAWRGVMTQYAGFYDLTLAWSHVLWGCVLGALVASLEFQTLFIPYYELVIGGSDATQGPNLFVLLWFVAMHSAAAHLILRRTKVREASAQTTSGWALGAAMGGMQGLFLSAQLLNANTAFDASHRWLGAAAFGLLLPRLEATLTAWQGHLMLQGRRLGAVFRAAAWRMVLLTLAYFAFFQPLIWLVAVVVLLSAEPRVGGWVWDGLSPQAKRALRRVRAERARELRNREREEE